MSDEHGEKEGKCGGRKEKKVIQMCVYVVEREKVGGKL